MNLLLNLFKNKVTYVIIIIVISLLTVNFLSWNKYRGARIELEKAKVMLSKVQSDNEVLKKALDNQAKKVGPGFTTTRIERVDLSEAQKAKLEKEYGDKIGDLLSQIDALTTIITSTTYTSGYEQSPVYPNQSSGTIICVPSMHRIMVGGSADYGFDSGKVDGSILLGIQLLKNHDISVYGEYQFGLKQVSLGGMVRF